MESGLGTFETLIAAEGSEPNGVFKVAVRFLEGFAVAEVVAGEFFLEKLVEGFKKSVLGAFGHVYKNT